MEKQDQLLMKKQNKNLVLDIIKNKSPISRTEVAKVTGMSPTSITRIVSELHSQGFVRETELVTSGVGRKATLLDVCEDVLYTIGVEIDKLIIKIGIVDYVGKIVAWQTITRDEVESYDETLMKINRGMCYLIEEHQLPSEKIIGIGVGLPGSIDYMNGLVKISDQLKWKHARLASDLKQLTGFDVIIDNELKMKVIAENFKGMARDSQNAVLVGIGSGIGAAIILNGEIYRGDSNNAGEIGHTVIDPTGNVCNCGKIGCLATYISEGAIIADSKKIKNIQSIDEVFAAYRKRDSWAINIMDRTTTYIALALSNILCLYNPEVIILSGDTIEKLPELKGEIERKCELYIWEPIKDTLKVVYSGLSNQGVVLGAALQVQNSMLDLD
ncbi:ROK family transcriptional regulator [Neobacillus sp. MM2021_6]|uniref:ROK family transcriptional regulator n=1 Tax=Bacillaceae TaxID=186817 RepID=UPI00140A8A5B|nr:MULTISPECIES: ROK family transcriptional regulator [Bacillaceae]MBO0958829.1 ROK family transcriptional regulator [Neobacillus sp. MM2021_6]NHC21386.1 ROK family transcriptional regulator [Bacillus sp. MM2020_4]